MTDLMNLFKKHIQLFAVAAMLLLVLPLQVSAQQHAIKVEAKIDSLAILIGDQTDVHLYVTCDANQFVVMPAVADTLPFTLEDVVMPQIRDSLSKDIEVIERSAIDTARLNDGKRITLHQSFTITSFNPGLYHLDSFEVVADSDTYCSNTLALKVWAPEEFLPENNTIDEKYLYTFCDIKDIRPVPLLFSELKPSLFMLLGVAVLVLLFLYLLNHYRKNQPILRRVRLEPKIPAHIQAGQSLDLINDSKGWMKDDAKTYYTELTDALRVYIQNRFGINATEMTSTEVLESIKDLVDGEQHDEIRNLLTTSDFAKFAKFQPYENEKVHHYGVVTHFVDTTKPEEVPGEEQVIEYVEVVKGMSVTSKRWLLVAIVIIAVAALVLLAWLITSLIWLFI